jgi:hypothetical protein
MKLLFFIPMLCMGLFSHTDFLFFHQIAKGASFKEFRIKFNSKGERKVELMMDKCDVKITGYDGDEVLIEAMGIEAPPKRAEGLKPLYNTAEDNSGLGLSVTQENNTVKIIKATSHREVKYTIKVPRKISLLFEEVNHHSRDITISGIEGDVEVKTKSSDIYLDNISGSVVANSIGGDVTVVFTNLSQQKPSAISVVGSIVDVTLPADTKADFKMKSISGEIYTDFDLAVNDSKEGLRKVGGGHHIEGKANGGGVAMSIETVGSDIFIRKKKS